MDGKSLMIGLLLEIVSILILISSGKILKKRMKKMNFTNEEELSIGFVLMEFFFGEKKTRKMLHIRKIYFLITMFFIGFFSFFSSSLAITIIVFYAFIISSVRGKLIILPFLVILLSALVFLTLTLISRFNEKFRLFMERLFSRRKGPIIIFEGYEEEHY